MEDTEDTRRIYVVSFAPSYDESSIGGCEWRSTRSEAVRVLAACAEDEGSDLRLTVLDLPSNLTDEEITDFLSGGDGREIVDPPDPRGDLAGAIECWRENAGRRP